MTPDPNADPTDEDEDEAEPREARITPINEAEVNEALATGNPPAVSPGAVMYDVTGVVNGEIEQIHLDDADHEQEVFDDEKLALRTLGADPETVIARFREWADLHGLEVTGPVSAEEAELTEEEHAELARQAQAYFNVNSDVPAAHRNRGLFRE